MIIIREYFSYVKNKLYLLLYNDLDTINSNRYKMTLFSIYSVFLFLIRVF